MSRLIMMMIAAGFLIITPMKAQADDVLESIEQAVTLYKQGDFSGAAGNLDYAAQLIRQQKGAQMEQFLPEARPGWIGGDIQTATMGAMMLGGGVSAERTYEKEGEDGRITVSIVTDSPVLQSMLMMFTNPAVAASSGAKMETIAGQRAVVNYTVSERGGEINMVVANRILVTVKGHDVEKNELVDYVGAINFRGLSKME